MYTASVTLKTQDSSCYYNQKCELQNCVFSLLNVTWLVSHQETLCYHLQCLFKIHFSSLSLSFGEPHHINTLTHLLYSRCKAKEKIFIDQLHDAGFSFCFRTRSFYRFSQTLLQTDAIYFTTQNNDSRIKSALPTIFTAKKESVAASPFSILQGHLLHDISYDSTSGEKNAQN